MMISFMIKIFILTLISSVKCCPFSNNGDSSLPCPMNGDKNSNLRNQAVPKTTSPSTLPSRAPTFSFTPGVCQKLQGATLVPTVQNICSAYSGIKAAFPTVLPNATTQLSAYSDLLGKSVRLIWHDAGEAYLSNITDKMGSDGCLSNSPDNAGLVESDSTVLTILEPLWQQYCDKISRADFWVLFATLVVQYTATPSGVHFNYQFGRKDSHSCNAGNGRLPDAQNGLNNIHQVFVNQLGLTMSDAVTLLGAHTLGHVHTASSGYGLPAKGKFSLIQNAWDPTPTVFDNKYYQIMLGIPWRNVEPNGNKTNLFVGVNANLITLNQNIMLNTDMSLGFVAGTAETIGTHGVGYVNQTCGPKSVNGTYGCTAGSVGLGKNTSRPYTNSLALQYTKNNQLFLDNFAASFLKLTTVGYGIAPAAAGKLGLLTSVNLTACANIPTNAPTNSPTLPTSTPIVTSSPSSSPTLDPSQTPSTFPSFTPSSKPSSVPTSAPSIFPSSAPSLAPSKAPTIAPSKAPSVLPSLLPARAPSTALSNLPSSAPSKLPSSVPSNLPSSVPSNLPSSAPSTSPSTSKPVPGGGLTTSQPLATPKSTSLPSKSTVNVPSASPSTGPITKSTIIPTKVINQPTIEPSKAPSKKPAAPRKPTISPTSTPV